MNYGNTTLLNCTVSGNSAYEDGAAGIWNGGTRFEPDQLHSERQLLRPIRPRAWRRNLQSFQCGR